jgi:hypothetical protein
MQSHLAFDPATGPDDDVAALEYYNNGKGKASDFNRDLADHKPVLSHTADIIDLSLFAAAPQL